MNIQPLKTAIQPLETESGRLKLKTKINPLSNYSLVAFSHS